MAMQLQSRRSIPGGHGPLNLARPFQGKQAAPGLVILHPDAAPMETHHQPAEGQAQASAAVAATVT